MTIGFNVGQIWNFDTVAERQVPLQESKIIGATSVRIGVPWAQVDKGKGVYDWVKTRAIINQVVMTGLEPFVAIGVWPAVKYGGFGGAFGGRRGTAVDYGNMVADFVQTFPEVSRIELMNEPNLISHWADVPLIPLPMFMTPKPSAKEYVAHVIAAYDAVKAVRPDVTVVAGALAALTTGSGNIDPVRFVDGMYEFGLKGHFDALSFHPYPIDGKWNPEVASDMQMMMIKSDLIRDLMERYGDADKGMVWTEYGASIGNRSEEEQMQVLVKGVDMYRNRDYVSDLFVYTITDIPSMKSDKERYYGIVRPDGRHKLAYEPFKQAAFG